MSSASRSAATAARATTSSVASSTQRRRRVQSGARSSARSGGSRGLITLTGSRFSTARAREPDQVVLVVDVVGQVDGRVLGRRRLRHWRRTRRPVDRGSITERNFLGRGQYIRLSAGGGENSRDYSLVVHGALFPRTPHSGRLRCLPATRGSYDHYDRASRPARPCASALPITRNAVDAAWPTTRPQEEYDLSTTVMTMRRRDGDERLTRLRPLAGYHRRRRREPVDQVIRFRHAHLQHHRRHEEPANGHLSPTSRPRSPAWRRCAVRRSSPGGRPTTARCRKSWISSVCSTRGAGHIAGFGATATCACSTTSRATIA